jgi:hypothetical protein
MILRKVLSIPALAAAGGVTLLLVSPWVNPCIGANRFSKCIEPMSPMADPENPELLCYWGACDFFPSLPEKIARLSLLLLILLIPAVLSARNAKDDRAIHAFTTLLATIVVGFLLTLFFYPYAFAGGY